MAEGRQEKELIFLGTGTSTGVPQLRCHCTVCRSADPRDKRQRCSALLCTPRGNILIDCGPDFRGQMLRYAPDEDIDALLVTHEHYDHVGGIDDLRPYTHGKGHAFPIYCDRRTAAAIRTRMPYCFADNPYPGVPRIELKEVSGGEHFEVLGYDFEALEVMHGRLPILGYRMGHELGYVTDASYLPEATYDALHGVETLVINALRIQEHPTHFNLSESLEAVERISPRRAYLIHLSHDMGLHEEVGATLPSHVHIAYDGLRLHL